MKKPTVAGLWRAMPPRVQDLVSMAVAVVRGERRPVPPIPSDRLVRVMIAPANYAGQGYRWARALERHPDVAAVNMVIDSINPFGYAADDPVPGRIAAHSRRWQRGQFDAITQRFTHMLVEAEMRPLGSAYGKDLFAQIEAIRAGGVQIGMICHGSDVRLPSRHAALEEWSPFQDDSWVPVAELEKVVQGNLDLLARVAAPTFVSTPGLLLDVPDSHLLPVVIDPGAWRQASAVLERERPVVVHIPSNPLVKGTAEILPVVERLDAQGLIEFRSVSGVRHEEMAALYGTADIVLDQFRLGDYGVAACEAMAAGRLVVSHVSEQVRGVVAETSGLSLPIVEADLDGLESVLRDIVARRRRYADIAASGPAFVSAVHDGRMSARVLEESFLFA